MKTCLSDDRPVWSLLFGIFWLAVGTWHLVLWYSGVFAEFWWPWLFLLIGLANYGLALYALRNGLSNRSEWLHKLFEPRWLADNRE